MDLQGKREEFSRRKGKRESGRGARRFELIPTLLPGRAHARPNRNQNRFPGWSHPPAFDVSESSGHLIVGICSFVLVQGFGLDGESEAAIRLLLHDQFFLLKGRRAMDADR